MNQIHTFQMCKFIWMQLVRCLLALKQLRFVVCCANSSNKWSQLRLSALKYRKWAHVDLSNQKIKKNYTVSRGGAEIGISIGTTSSTEKGNDDPKRYCFRSVPQCYYCWNRRLLILMHRVQNQCTACSVIFTFFL